MKLRCLHCKTYMWEKIKTIHTTVHSSTQHETVDLKTPLQDLRLNVLKKNNPYSVERLRLIFMQLLFPNFQENKQCSSGLDLHIIGVFASLIRRSHIPTFVKLTKLSCVTSIKTFILQFKAPLNMKQ